MLVAYWSIIKILFFLCYRSIRKILNSYPLSRNEKTRICSELKSYIIENGYPNIKRKILNCIYEAKLEIVASFSKLNTKLNEDKKQELYIELFNKIVNGIDDDVEIMFDSFSNKNYEEKIIREISINSKVKDIDCDFSYNSKGLQLADNVCGVIRKHIEGIDKNNYFETIKDHTKIYL